jgi:hypothetical protein
MAFMRMARSGRGLVSEKPVRSEKGGEGRRRIESGHARYEMKVPSVTNPRLWAGRTDS